MSSDGCDLGMSGSPGSERGGVDAVIAEVLALYDSPQGVGFQPHYEGAHVIAHGWYEAVRDWARGALLLGDAGLAWTAAPLRRSMIEHALALEWLADKPDDAFASLHKKEQWTVRKLEQHTAGGEWSIPPELFAEILDPPAPGSAEDVNVNFTHLALAKGERNLLAAWLHETSFSHPSFSSAQRYLVTLPGVDQADIERVVVPDTNTQQVALLLLLATGAFHRFLTGEPWAAQLAQLESRFVSALRAAAGG